MNLANYRILVAEDDYLLSEDMAEALREAGSCIVGPVSTAAEAMHLLDGGHLDGAVLDVGLRDGCVSQVVAILRRRMIPYVIVSGYDHDLFPDLAPRCAFIEKPAAAEAVLSQLAVQIITTRRQTALAGATTERRQARRV